MPQPQQQPSIASLTAIGQGFEPMAPGIAHRRRTGLEGLPFMESQGPMGMLAQMGVGPQIIRGMGQVGMVPSGVGHDQGFYDVLRNMQYTQIQMRAMQRASEADRENFFRTFRGMAAITGTPFGAEQRRAAESLSSAAALAAPIFATIMAEMMDQLGGGRGSATVMAQRMIDAGRYRIDPVTGRMGMSSESVGLSTQRLFRDLYSDSNIANMQGVTAGQLGSLYQQLQSRGMLTTHAAEAGHGGFASADPRGQVQRAVDNMSRDTRGMQELRTAAERVGVDLSRTSVGGMQGEELDRLMNAPEVSGRLRAFDAERVRRSLMPYVNAVSAMRDIFGDAGRPNAPMHEIMQGLEALSMGQMAQIDPGRMANIVRQTNNLARQTGVTLDTAMMMQQHAGARAQQMGVEPVFAIHATQGALGFGGAYRAQGHGAHTAWGAMNSDQLTQMDSNMRVQASASNMANRMAVVMRVRDTMGGFDPNSRIGRYASAVESGLHTFQDDDGEMRSVNLRERDFLGMVGGAQTADGRSLNMNENDIRDMTMQRSTNREYIDRHNIQAVVRRAQGTQELHPFIGQRLQETLTTRLRDNLVQQGLDHATAFSQARAAARAVSTGATRRIFGMSTEEFASTQQRNEGISRIIEDELAAAGHGGSLHGLSEDDRRNFLTGTAERFYGHANRAIQGSVYRGFGNMQNIHRLTNETTLNESDAQNMQARFTARMQTAMSSLGRGTLLSRAVDALQEVRTDDPQAFMRALSSTLGGVSTRDINRALLTPMVDITNQQQAIVRLRDQISQTRDPAQRSALMRQLDSAYNQLQTQAQAITTIGERHGMFADNGLSSEELERTLNSGNRLNRNVANLHGVRTNMGSQITDEEVRDTIVPPAGTQTQYTQNDATAILRARRAREMEMLRVDHNVADISPDTRAAFNNAVASARRDNPGMNDMQVRQAALTGMQWHNNAQNPESMTDPTSQAAIRRIREAGAGQVITPDEARAMILTRRLLTDVAPTEAQVQATVRQYGAANITDGEARELVHSNLRAGRMGITERQIADNIGNNPAATWHDRVRAIDSLMTEQRNRQYTITPADREEYVRNNQDTMPRGRESITNEHVAAFRRLPGHANLTDEEARTGYLDRLILDRRQADTQRNFQQFWNNPDGAAFRESVDQYMQDTENVSQRLIATPAMVRRLGSRAVGMHQALQGHQRRLRELSLLHARGDVARLMAGDTDINTNTRGGQELRTGVDAEVASIRRQIHEFAEDLQDTEGQEGRQWQLGDERTATSRVTAEEVAAGRMTPFEAGLAMAAVPNRDQRRTIQQRRHAAGSELRAREVLGIAANAQNLSEWQQAKIAGVRHGAGVEEEITGAVGAVRWAGLTDVQRAEMTATLRRGTGDHAAGRMAAMTLLQLDPAWVGTNRWTDEHEERVTATMVGFQTDAHARQLMGVRADMSAEQRQRLTMAGRLGIASEGFARHTLGMLPSVLSPALQARVMDVRQLQGNREEAMRLLGFDGDLTPAQNTQVTQLMQEIGVARRLTPQQEQTVRQQTTREAEMRTIARNHRSTVEEMTLFNSLANRDGTIDARGSGALAMRPMAVSAANQAGVNEQRANFTTAQAGLTAARARLNTILAELNGPNVAPERRRQLLFDLENARQDVTGQEDRLRRAHDGVSGAAGEAGASTTEMLNGQRSGQKLTIMSTADREQVSRAKLGHERARQRLNTANNRIDRIQRQLAALDTAPGGNEQRAVRQANLRAELEAAQIEAGTALSQQQTALSGIEDLASGRGVTPQQLLSDQGGSTSQAARNRFNSLAGDNARGLADIDAIASQFGVGRADILGAGTVGERLDGLQRQAVASANTTPTNLIQQIHRAYGLQAPTNAAALPVAQLMNTTPGRQMAASIIGSQNALRESAIRGGFVTGNAGLASDVNSGISSMATEYQRVMALPEANRAADMQTLQQRLRLDSRDGALTTRGQQQWRQFQNAMQFQQQTRFLQFGAGPGRGGSDAQLFDRFRDSMQGGALQPVGGAAPGGGPAGGPGGPGGGAGGPMQISGNLTGTLRIVGETGTLVAAAGGSRNMTVAPA